MDSKRALSVFALIAVLPLVSAVPECALGHYMPEGAWLYQALLCVSEPYHGWIYTVAPPGIPQQLKMFKVQLQSYAYVPPYAATLNCYEQFTDVEPPSRIGGKGGFGTLNSIPGGTLNSVPQGPLYSWHLLQQVTLNSGQGTSPSSSWVLAGCPPVSHGGQQAGSPPQVRIDVSWGGVNKRATAIAAPDYTAIGIPFIGYLGGYIDALAGRTASTLKTKRARR